MSKSVSSDGAVNALVEAMCQKGFASYQRAEVDQVLTDPDNLKQCEYGTLLHAGYRYIEAFGAKCWPIQEHAEIKAWQSEIYRAHKGHQGKAKKKKGATAPAPVGDPLHALLGKAPTTQEPQAETQEQPKEEPAPETPEQQQTREEVDQIEARMDAMEAAE